MPDPPKVTGLSPKEGPPGTRVTIRGENLGIIQQDLTGLTICGIDCLMTAEWKSNSKIVCRSGPGKGRGDVIVTTASGGLGSCTVQFRGYFEQTGPTKESAVWIDESQMIIPGIGRTRPQSPVIQQQEDPLGLSDESNIGRISEEELLELFPEGSGNWSLENFVPAWFLLENHHGTSFDDLKAGLAHLKRKSKQRSEGPMTFVKANLTSFMDCMDTLGALQNIVMQDKQEMGDDITMKMEECALKSKNKADELFQEVLGRKDRADSTRNALNVMQRFKFLFGLPQNIDRNIQKGDYEFVISDYAKAKSLFANTEIQIFTKVYKEVESRTVELREKLHKKLMELPSTLDEQKRLIRYLVDLESPGDPAWDCITNQYNWILKLFNNCKDEHISREQSSADHQETPTGSRLRRQFQSSPNSSFYKDNQNLITETSGSHFKSPERIIFIEELSEILMEGFPHLWKLGQVYFSGELSMKETGEKSAKVDIIKNVSFKKMILSVVNLYSNLIKAALQPILLEVLTIQERTLYGMWQEMKDDNFISWLPHGVRTLRACYKPLTYLDLPTDALDIIQNLIYSLRTHCMIMLLKQAAEDVKNLHTHETWHIEMTEEYGGTTQLPILFENVVLRSLQLLKEIVNQAVPGEAAFFSQALVVKEVTLNVGKLLEAFTLCLDHLAFVVGVDRTLQSSSLGDNVKVIQDDRIPGLETRLLITLSNCNFVRYHSIPRLIENFEKHGYTEMKEVYQRVDAVYEELDERLFDAYIDQKADPIIGTIEQHMYTGRFDWNDCVKPTGVRSYVQELLMCLIVVHAEIYCISPIFVSRVLTKVIERVAEELARLVHCIPQFSEDGTLQAQLDLLALQDAVINYKTEEARISFTEALKYLPTLNGVCAKKSLEKLLNQFKSNMRFQLLCLQNDMSSEC